MSARQRWMLWLGLLLIGIGLRLLDQDYFGGLFVGLSNVPLWMESKP